MEFTGERYVPGEQGAIRLEHVHRYAAVLDLTADKHVLDIASGEGYGSFMISESAKTVVGVDIAEDAIRHASTTYKKGNLKFSVGSATQLNFAAESFDVVVSFETLEHLAEHELMVSEIRRVLKPGGIFILSTPNRPVYSKNGAFKNEFHIKELDFIEFHGLLTNFFPKVMYYGQRLMIGSAILPINNSKSIEKIWQDDGVVLQES